jgi:DNA helicase-2/ATP-dependent DNA helicase PcrA
MISATEIAARLGTPSPTPEQVAVIEAPLEPLLVVAGAGSGKTETMSARVVYLVANGLVPSDGVLGLTFTRKAAGELAERIQRRLSQLAATGLRLPGRANAPTSGSGIDWPGDTLDTRLVRPTVATYNSYAATLVADHGLRIGHDPTSRIITPAAAWQIIHNLVTGWPENIETTNEVSTVTRAVRDLAGEMADHLVDRERVEQVLARLIDRIESLDTDGSKSDQRDRWNGDLARLRLRHQLLDLVAAYQERKRELGVIDYADQVALAARLAAEHEAVGQAERARYPVVLLDEYQDTSHGQLVLLSNLFGAASGTVGHPVTAVGDPNQAIYGWRGASEGGTRSFPHQFPQSTGEPATTVHLATSWRNDLAILAVANHISAPLRGSQAPVLAARPGAGQGEVSVGVYLTPTEEAAGIAEYLRHHWHPAGHGSCQPKAPDGKALANVADSAGADEPTIESGLADKPTTAAVLVRKTKQIPEIHRGLLAAGIPVEVVGLGGLLSQPEIADVIAVLYAAHDPARGDHAMRILTMDRFSLGIGDLHALHDLARDLSGRIDVGWEDQFSILDAIDHLRTDPDASGSRRQLTPEGRAKLLDVAQILAQVRSRANAGLVELVRTVIVALGLDIEVDVRRLRGGAGRANLEAFVSTAKEYAGTEQATLGGFLAWLEAVVSEERGLEVATEVNEHAVQLLTVHAAKGLEWDVVVVPGLAESDFPVINRSKGGWLADAGTLPYELRGDHEFLPVFHWEQATDVKDYYDIRKDFGEANARHDGLEERRLAYVAFTRARSKLALTMSHWGTRKTVNKPSCYLTEVRELAATQLLGRLVLGVMPGSMAEDEPVGETNPYTALTETALFPPPLPPHRQVEIEAAEQVRAAQRAIQDGGHPAWDDELDANDELTELVDLARLLRDEELRRQELDEQVVVPDHMSISGIGHASADPAEFALNLRRPIPQRTSRQQRRGTDFHAWIESYFGQPELLTEEELPGADDDSLPTVADAKLQENFLASPWAQLKPVAVEVPVETPIDTGTGQITLRGRIDAVFVDEDGRATVVDWKSGRPPRGEDALRVAAQLAAYRLAWSRLTGVDLAQVDGAFFYASTGETVRPDEWPDLTQLVSLIVSGALDQ